MLEREGVDEFKDFTQDTENPEYIVIGDNRSCFDFDHLNKALRLIIKGARLIGMQSELIDSSMGELELNVGSWVGMLERASGVRATYIGKPNPYMFELAVKTMGLDKSEIIMVGDRVSTDVKGAQEFGIRSLLVKTGEFNQEDLDGGVKPDYILDSVRDLLTVL
jgi:HAD superfamily hydrolase (TIGR01450 family)